jgi:hypothetical protein
MSSLEKYLSLGRTGTAEAWRADSASGAPKYNLASSSTAGPTPILGVDYDGDDDVSVADGGGGGGGGGTSSSSTTARHPSETLLAAMQEETAMLAEVSEIEAGRRGKRKRISPPRQAVAVAADDDMKGKEKKGAVDGDLLPTFIPIAGTKAAIDLTVPKRLRSDGPSRAPQTVGGWAHAPWRRAATYPDSPAVA